MVIVIDTCVIVAGLRSRQDGSNRLLQLVSQGHLRPLVTTPLFLDYEAVLKRPESQLATGLGLAQIDVFLGALASACHGVETHYRWRPQLRDSADEMVLECVVNGSADYLVTFNQKDYGSSDKQFGYELVTPGRFCRSMINYEQKQLSAEITALGEGRR
jgi:putative PIN family toxin of toxin-antitoxin system